jgi:hypothetical protein
MNFKELTLMELLLAKQWVGPLFKNEASKMAGLMDISYFRMLGEANDSINKELWKRIISEDTPWDKDKKELVFSDDNFKETVKEVLPEEK